MSARPSRPGQLPPAAPPSPPPVPRGRRRREGYRYYLEDHPSLAPIVTLALGGLCLYLSIFTNTMQGWMAGPNATRSNMDNVNTIIAWGVAFVLALMGIALIFLVWQLIGSGVRRVRRRPAVCPRCGTVEVPGTLLFAHQPVAGTSWETVVCPKCGHEWHSRL
jgi:hypothetical protein